MGFFGVRIKLFIFLESVDFRVTLEFSIFTLYKEKDEGTSSSPLYRVFLSENHCCCQTGMTLKR